MANLPDISEHLPIKDGFCRPNWMAIAEVFEQRLPQQEWDAAWQAVSHIWLERIREKLGGDYQVYETVNFLILAQAPARIINEACRFFEDARKKILIKLDGVAIDVGYGKHVVMMFASLDDYYGYISCFYPEGVSPMSGGICLNEGYLHFALPTTDDSSYRTVLVHELTHGCLSHLPIPAWLNEALAMRMEHLICGTDFPLLDRDHYEQHQAHWNAETIQRFWTGEAWQIAGDAFELSYSLAMILWSKIEAGLAAPPEVKFQFIADAHFEDGGEAAFQKHFDFSLGDLVVDFLGEGSWAPKPDKWQQIRDSTSL